MALAVNDASAASPRSHSLAHFFLTAFTSAKRSEAEVEAGSVVLTGDECWLSCRSGFRFLRTLLRGALLQTH